MKMTIKAQGVTDWAKDLVAIVHELPDIEKEIVTDLGLFLEFNAKAALDMVQAVDTGRLKASIGHFTASDTTSPEASSADAHFDVKPLPAKGFSVEIGTNVFYAEYVEFGTSRMAARPFLEMAANATEQYIVTGITKKLTDHGLM